MDVKVGFGAAISILLLLNGNSVSARKKEAADPDATYLACLQGGMSAAPQGDPEAARIKVLADCLLTRRGIATVTEALLILDGTAEKRARAQVDEMLAAADQKALGISRQDDAAIFAAYGALEKQLSNAKVAYQVHPDGQIECVLTQSSGDPEVDATRCKSMRGCPRLDPKTGAKNEPVFRCMGNEQRRKLLFLAAGRAGFGSSSADSASNTPNH